MGRFAAKDRHGSPEFWNRRRLPFAMKEQVFEKAIYGLIEQGSRKIIVHHTQVEHHFGEFHSNIYIYIYIIYIDIDVVVPHIIAQCWEPAASGWVKKKSLWSPKVVSC